MSTILRLLSSVFGTIFIGFGINAVLNPASALSFFELQYPTISTHKQLVDVLLAVYGVRDVFMGIVIYVAASLGSRKTLGWVMLAAAGVAVADGAVCKNMVGSGEWNHWGYSPVVAVLALVILSGIGAR